MKSNNVESANPRDKLPQRVISALERPELNRILITGILLVVIYFLRPRFFSMGNINLLLTWGSIYAIAALGETLALLVGGFDLSVGGVVSFGSVFVAKLLVEFGLGWWLAVPATLLICLIIGFVSGYFSTRFSPPFPFLFPAFIFTLSVHFILLGVMQYWTRSLPITPLPSGFKTFTMSIGGVVPMTFIYMIVIAGLLSFFLYYKPIGWKIFATGQDDEAARYTGVNTTKVRILAYMGSALLVGLAGILIASSSNAASWQAGASSLPLMTVLVIPIVGGVSLSGGEGSPLMAVVGGFLIYSIENLIITLNISPYYQQAIMGILIIVFVSYDFLRQVK
ncbi:MAG: ABC transporter permease [Candidatus Bipolaricaulota bacterium]